MYILKASVSIRHLSPTAIKLHADSVSLPEPAVIHLYTNKSQFKNKNAAGEFLKGFEADRKYSVKTERPEQYDTKFSSSKQGLC